jgi:hypothetical protein
MLSAVYCMRNAAGKSTNCGDHDECGAQRAAASSGVPVSSWRQLNIAALEKTVQRGKTMVKLLKLVHLNNTVKVETTHIKGVGYPLVGAAQDTTFL